MFFDSFGLTCLGASQKNARVGVVGKLGDALAALKDVLGALINALGELRDVLAALKGALGALSDALRKLRDAPPQ